MKLPFTLPPAVPLERISNPEYSDVKPASQTLEGKLAAYVTLAGILLSFIVALGEAFPNNPKLQAAVAIAGALISALTALGLLKKRCDVKSDANRVAGAIAIAKATGKDPTQPVESPRES